MTAIKRELARDRNQRAKSIADIVAAISEGENPDTLGQPTAMDPDRVAAFLLPPRQLTIVGAGPRFNPDEIARD